MIFMESSIFKINNSISDNKGIITAEICLDYSHEIYKGHFPEKPITPGVVFIQIIKTLMERHYECSLLTSEIKSAKFLNPVTPREDLPIIFTISFSEIEDQIVVKNLTTFTNNDAVFNCNATFVKIHST